MTLPELLSLNPLTRTRLIPEVSIVFPAYNEAENIASVVDDFARVLSGIAAELIVVNDGSSDDTQRVLNSLPLPNLRVIEHATNLGYGAALRSGFKAALGQWTFFTDSDRQFRSQDFLRLWEKRMEADVILGVRSHRQDPSFRRLNAWLWGQYIKRVFSVDVRDVNCAFKLLPTSELQSFHLQSAGAFINAEMLSHFHDAQCTWLEVSVQHHPREIGVQTGAHPKVIAKALHESLRFLWHKNRT